MTEQAIYKDKIKGIKERISILKDIHTQLHNNYDNIDWDLSSFDYAELEIITGLENHDWDENNLAHYIDGMQRTLKLMGLL